MGKKNDVPRCRDALLFTDETRDAHVGFRGGRWRTRAQAAGNEGLRAMDDATRRPDVQFIEGGVAPVM